MHVLLYIPNLIGSDNHDFDPLTKMFILGYFRLCLLGFAWYYFDQPLIFLPLYIIQALLDAVDGWAARRFNQVSKFGAWLDVIIDNIGRGMVWTRISSIGIFISSIEWITFVALNTHGSAWKENLSSTNDIIVRNIMKNGFRTPFGLLTIVLGIHCLPIVIYMMTYEILIDWSKFILYNIKTLCIVGRLFSFYCEIYVIRLFIIEDLLK